MKKILGLLMAFLLMLTGCVSDEDYISTTKSITSSDGQTIEQYVNNIIKAGEISISNEVLKVYDEEMIAALVFVGEQEGLSFLEKTKMKIPEDIGTVTWEIEGETKAGKVVVASNENIKVKIETEKDGDYIRVDGEKIFVTDKTTNKVISQEELNVASAIYDLAEKCGYRTPKRFNEKEVLENKDGFYTLEYYPSGRVKYLSDDAVVELELEDRSYLKDTAEELKELDGEIGKYNDESINKLGDFAYYLEYQIIAEKLNKKITKEEKEEIKKLEKEAMEVFERLQFKVDQISGY